MSIEPLVSVVIPSYNHKEFILKAIESVLNQTYKNVEIVVVDDGSTDGSVEMLEEESGRLGFKFIAQSNRGVSRTLNRAIRELSTGEYICFLASDDYFAPTKVEKQLEALRKSDLTGFCYTQSVEFDSNTGAEIRTFPKKTYSGNVLDSLIIRQPYAGGTIMVKRAVYDSVGGFDESLSIEDWDFSIRCAAVTEFVCVHEPLFYYRSHSTNSMKIMGRRKIFLAKAMILSKNYMLVSPSRWIFALLVNFVHDHAYVFTRHLRLKKI
ncbi:glycosyltransferase [Marinobacter zhejiangensis]|uniref:Alpha-1,3-rhamnosyltransferase n=1 Tax=Marinobacter zhejiangensis TaxID=488535 RepID=A0A1I4QQA4_9GAMM|nr:glycosyltransferase [Marinobacter zhejiangensis]SFM42224.1 alpha-1,3-rhamnosyltransferase [Marinobacter zhejiangensis]